MNVTINPSGNSYSYDLTLQGPLTTEQFRQVFKVNYNTSKTRQKIFGSINGDFTYNSDETNGKNVGQGFLSAYRNGSFQTSWYNAFSTGTNRTYKVNGTTNKYLIGIYYSFRDDTFFGIDENGNFTYGLSQNDPNAQFEIEIYATEQDAINSINSELAAAQQAAELAAQQAADLAALQAAAQLAADLAAQQAALLAQQQQQQEAELAAQQAAAQLAADLAAQQAASQLPKRTSKIATQTPLGGARVRTTTQTTSTPRRRATQQRKTTQKRVTARTSALPTPKITTTPVQATQPITAPTTPVQTQTQTVRPTKTYSPVISRGQRPRVYQRRSGKKLSPTNARQIGIGF